MKNKNLQQAELELINKLLGVVNSKEEFDYWEAEKRKLPAFFSKSEILGNQLNKLMEI